MKQTFYIHEDEQGQHLRAEIGEGEIVLISHEIQHRPVSFDEGRMWRDRYLATIEIHVWRAIAHVAGE